MLHLTTKPHFIETHLNRTRKHNLLICSPSSLSSLDYEAVVLVDHEVNFPLKDQPGTDLEVVGLSNGLACIMPQPEALFIFNPTTGKSMRVPDSPPPRTKHRTKPSYGFGYAPSIKDYRIVKIYLFDGIVFQFSLNDKSWKRVQDVPGQCGIPWKKWEPLNRSFHWLTGYNVEDDPLLITAFDLADGKFSDLPLPESFEGHYDESFLTGTFGGCLCLLEKRGFRSEFSCWVMEKYGVNESWTRIWFSIHDHHLKPICYWKNTKKLLRIFDYCHSVVCLANPEDGTYLIGPMNKEDEEAFYDPLYPAELSVWYYVYVESLVSPNFQNK